MRFEPTIESLQQHGVPAWFDDAKLGIFIHWGPFSVPAWAPPTQVNFVREDWFRTNAYAEWYQNTLAIDGSPTQQHHAETYGADYPYERFGEVMREGVASWDPAAWAELFAAAGARYVVPTTKHHDGFLLWPSEHPNPQRKRWHLERDAVGELGAAVRAKGMRYGLYYSGGLDWTFGGMPIDSREAMMRAIHQNEAYAQYVDAHWRELIARYAPDVLWNDIGYPRTGDFNRLFADYYNAQPDGLVNDRFDARGARLGDVHHDFFTPEYAVSRSIKTKKWESCRGIGNSFGYNRAEPDEVYATGRELIQMLCDVVSKNGNLLLNVGPTGAGEIPWIQQQRLLELGQWLRVNGEAIYGTRPWHAAHGPTAEATTAEGCSVRFTTKVEGGRDLLYALVFDVGEVGTVTLPIVDSAVGRVRMLGRVGELAHERVGDGVRVTLAAGPWTSPVIALELS